MTALDIPAAPSRLATETTPIWRATVRHEAREYARRLFNEYAEKQRASEPFTAHVCTRCGATGTEPCVTAGGKQMRRYHVARG
jgi:hypothetical protein